jgi:hypothetical protein
VIDTSAIPPDAPIVCTIRPGDDQETMIRAYRELFADAVLVNGDSTEWGCDGPSVG